MILLKNKIKLYIIKKLIIKKMGCSDPKVKIESEIIKMKMDRVEIQMERQNQLKLLKDIDGCEIKVNKIPDYIDNDYLESQETNRIKKKFKKIKLRKSKSMVVKKENNNNKYEGKKSAKTLRTWRTKKTSKY